MKIQRDEIPGALRKHEFYEVQDERSMGNRLLQLCRVEAGCEKKCNPIWSLFEHHGFPNRSSGIPECRLTEGRAIIKRELDATTRDDNPTKHRKRRKVDEDKMPEPLASVSDLRDELDRMTNPIDGWITKAQMLQSQLERKKAALDKQSAEIAEADNRRVEEHPTATLEVMQSHVVLLEGKLDHAAQKTKDMDARSTKLERQNDTLKGVLASCERLTLERDDARKRMTELERQKKGLQKEWINHQVDLTLQLDNSKMKRVELQRHNNELRASVSNQWQLNLQLAEENNNKITAHKKKVAKLQASLRAKDEARALGDKLLFDAESEQESLRGTLQSLEAQLHTEKQIVPQAGKNEDNPQVKSLKATSKSLNARLLKGKRKTRNGIATPNVNRGGRKRAKALNRQISEIFHHLNVQLKAADKLKPPDQALKDQIAEIKAMLKDQKDAHRDQVNKMAKEAELDRNREARGEVYQKDESIRQKQKCAKEQLESNLQLLTQSSEQYGISKETERRLRRVNKLLTKWDGSC